MKPKQEVWKFTGYEQSRLKLDVDYFDFVAIAFFDYYIVFRTPRIGGVSLKQKEGHAKDLADARKKIAREIRRQLAAHNVKVEIRRVKR